MTTKKVVRKKVKTSPQSHKKVIRRKRRRLKKSFIVFLIGVISVIVLILGFIFIPRIMNSNKLKDLGYDRKTVSVIDKLDLTKDIIKNGYYSTYLEESILDESVNPKYLSLYAVRESDRPLQEKHFILYNRLLDSGYTNQQVDNLFAKLDFFEISPLLVFDFQNDLSTYIQDCLDHHSTNNEEHFELTNDYYTEYTNVKPVDDPSNINMLVNKTYHLSNSMVPPNLTPLSVVYAAQDVQLSLEAAKAFIEWCDAGINLGIRFYASSAYRPYNYQEDLYNAYTKSMGQEQADALSARPGHSEHQTGLTVDLAASGSEGLSEYVDTPEYTWTSTNCQEYGWILRYPKGKTQITGYEFESWHYRYVGIDTAKAVVESKLTYDEYYCLYLKPWNNPELAYIK